MRHPRTHRLRPELASRLALRFAWAVGLCLALGAVAEARGVDATGEAAGLAFDYPAGLPTFVEPGTVATFEVQVTGFGGATHEPGTARLFAALGSAPFVEATLEDMGAGLYEATLPLAPHCADIVRFFLTADADDGSTAMDPFDAPSNVYETTAARNRVPWFTNDFEDDVADWVVQNQDLAAGAWEAVEPIGSLDTDGTPAAPPSAATGLRAFVTQNGQPNGPADADDVDGGPTDLVSPPLNILGADGQISYARWFHSAGGTPDELEVAITVDGENWTVVEVVDGAQNAWTVVSFRVSDFIVPGKRTQVRFRTMDAGDDSVTEAAIDDFVLERLVCDCPTIQCDDGNFCNGLAACDRGLCQPLDPPCPDLLCDEIDDVCITSLPLQARMGEPLPGLTDQEHARFLLGLEAFQREFTVEEGLGPIFNDVGCAACHNVPLGGSGTVKATRFGIDNGATFDPLNDLGGSLLQEMAIDPICAETVPAEANRTAFRVTTSALGAGLVEAIADADIEFRESNPPAPAVSGRVHRVSPREDPGTQRVGRFGWKSQEATVMSFSSGATAAEQGITNRFFPVEQEPNGDADLLDLCDTVEDPEDRRDETGFAYIDRITDFQRFLAPPPQTPREGMRGEAVFDSVGCASCHVATFVTRDDPALEPALRDKTLRPYSDFLLHNMGEAADFIGQDDALPRELRTAPLWGVRVRDPLWHDGTVEGGTFEERIRQAIELHAAPGSEAGASANLFRFLPLPDQLDVIAFLDSLGRAEFDHDGDGVLDLIDVESLLACFSGPGSVYTADDACSVSDVDRDGDVDDVDLEQFVVATDGAAGTVPDGAALGGAPLTVAPLEDGRLTLSWDVSCSPLDRDYAIYEGPIGDFAAHEPLRCSTGNVTTATIRPGAGDVYFLVVPTNGVREGGHGADSLGAARAAGPTTCLPRNAGVCGSLAPEVPDGDDLPM